MAATIDPCIHGCMDVYAWMFDMRMRMRMDGWMDANRFEDSV